MIPEWWSYLLAVIGLTGLYMTTKKMVSGFVIGVLVQILWVTYAVTTDQYGFIANAIGYAFMNCLGIYRWTRPKETEDK